MYVRLFRRYKKNRLIFRNVFTTVISVFLFACSASSQFSRSAQEHQLLREDITVNSLPLVIFRDAIASDSSEIHFYIDGDGSPWIHGNRIANDPTSRSQIILDLMAEDEADKILIGRPCYYMSPRVRPEICQQKWWTSHRYSPDIVTAMVRVIEKQIQRFEPRKVRLIGYSGGGTLAMLIGKELDEKISQVITIAANLDVDRWTELHGFSPLATSFNIENFPRLSERIKQTHFVGSEDLNVPADITQSVVLRQSNAKVIRIEGYSHECCWPNDWASRLRQATTNQ